MNFFKKLGKTATDLWGSNVYKVGSVRKISKINATLAKEESNIDALYLEIGKAYFDAHSTDADCEFSEKILAIKEAMQKIEDGEKQRLNLRKVQRCENCGAEISETMAFCTACGRAFTLVPKSYSVINHSPSGLYHA